MLRCHEACKTWRTCTKWDYMMWQWGVVSKCSPPPLKFNWIGLLTIQLNLFPTTHIKYSLYACEITKLPLIQDQLQYSLLSVLRCYEACKTWRTCTKWDYMMWQWDVASKCSPPPLKFNWIELLPIQLNLCPNTHIKYLLNSYEITKLPLTQKLV